MATSTGPTPTNEWFQPGDTIVLSDFNYYTFSSKTGGGASIDLFTTKKVPNNLSINNNILIKFIRKTGAGILENKSNIPVQRMSQNCISIKITFDSAIDPMIPLHVNLGGTITFS